MDLTIDHTEVQQTAQPSKRRREDEISATKLSANEVPLLVYMAVREFKSFDLEIPNKNIQIHFVKF